MLRSFESNLFPLQTDKLFAASSTMAAPFWYRGGMKFFEKKKKNFRSRLKFCFHARREIRGTRCIDISFHGNISPLRSGWAKVQTVFNRRNVRTGSEEKDEFQRAWTPAGAVNL